MCLTTLLLTTAFMWPAGSQGQRFPFYNLGVEDGLAQSQANCLAQGPDGALWIGTLGGLSRWDGMRFTNYSVRDGLLSNTIYALCFDDAGVLWIGSSKGLTAYDGKSMEHFGLPPAEGPAASPILVLAPVKGGGVWCVGSALLYQVTNAAVRAAGAPGNGAISAMYTEQNGRLWMARSGGDFVYRLQGRRWDSLKITSTHDRAKRRLVLTSFAASGRDIIIGSNDGLYLWDSLRNVVRDDPDSDVRPGGVRPTIFHLSADSDGGIWAATAAGACYIPKAGNRKLFNRKAGLTDNTIRYTLRDREGNIWLATDGQGIFRFSGAPFSALDESTGLPSGQVMGLAEDAGTLYVGTYDAGLYAYRNGRIAAVPFPDGSIPIIGSLLMRGPGELWIGTRGSGLWCMKNSQFTHYTPDAGALTSSFVSALSTDAQGRMWCGFGNGAAIYENNRFRALSLRGAAIVQEFLTLNADTTLICTGNGLRLYSISADKDYPFKTGTAADSATVQCLSRRAGNPDEVWMGTGDNGVIVFNRRTGKATVINKASGLRSEFIYNLLTDGEGAVWAGTGNGIYRISGRVPPYKVEPFGKDQGVVGIESNHRAALKISDGSLWFGTTEGAVHYVPGSSTVQPLPGPVVLTGIRLYGEEIRDTGLYDSLSRWYNVPTGLHLPYRRNNLSFTFHAASLTSGASVLYRYRMQGVDAGWSEWSTVNTVTYSALPPGKHRLSIQCGTDGRKAIREATYAFSIATPFQQTWAFRLLLAGAVLLLGVGIQYYAARRRIARRNLIESLRSEENAKVRQRTAEDFHDEVGNKLTRINVLTNVLKAKISDAHPDAQRLLSSIQDAASQLYGGTRDILWSLAPSNDSLFSILQRVQQIGEELFADTNVRFSHSGLDDAWKSIRLPMDKSRNLLMVFKEGLNNALKHAGATEVSLTSTETEKGVVTLVLSDNGKGFEPAAMGIGNGLGNMKLRAQRLDGTIDADSRPGEGTRLTLSFKIPQERG